VLTRLAAEHDGRTVIAVCHGGVIYRSMYHALGLQNGGFNGDVEFTSITEWRHSDGGWHLVRFNDVAHLMGSDLLTTV
jgi:broad specificity phosphatase PhoE